MIPGINLLNLAFRAIAPTTVQWYAAVSRAKNGIGLWVTTFAAPVAVTGSFQILNRRLIEQLGLEFNGEYVMFYTTNVVQDIERDKGPDQFVFNGQRYEVLPTENWKPIDGWNKSLAIRVTT